MHAGFCRAFPGSMGPKHGLAAKEMVQRRWSASSTAAKRKAPEDAFLLLCGFGRRMGNPPPGNAMPQLPNPRMRAVGSAVTPFGSADYADRRVAAVVFCLRANTGIVHHTVVLFCLFRQTGSLQTAWKLWKCRRQAGIQGIGCVIEAYR